MSNESELDAQRQIGDYTQQGDVSIALLSVP